MTINLTSLSVGLVHDTLDSQLTCSLFATETLASGSVFLVWESSMSFFWNIESPCQSVRRGHVSVPPLQPDQTLF